ncbi:MAG: DUF5711 family protein [Oscillospiraceae bacterium]|nr:DUF5711 family protein [Oscillospiraceae bacterium]
MNRNNINDISANRQRKKNDRNLLWIVVLAFFVIFVIVMAFNVERIVSPFEGIGERLGRRNISLELGFPVRLLGSADVIESSRDFDGFALLSSTYIYIYNSDGGLSLSRRHGYSNPILRVAGNRALLYDQNARRFSVFSRNGLLFENETDERIVYANIGSSGEFAIISRDASHNDTIQIFEADNNWRYTKRFSSENVMQVEFTQNEHIITTTIGFNAGRNIFTVRRFDTRLEEIDGLWEATFDHSNIVPVAININGDRTFVLCNGVLFVLDSNTGETIQIYEFRGNLIDHTFTDNQIAILVDDYTVGDVNVIMLNRNGELRETKSVLGGASQIELHKGNLTVLQPGVLTVFDDSSIQNDESNMSSDYINYSLSEDFARFIYLDDAILLLGYNTVERLDFDADEVL